MIQLKLASYLLASVFCFGASAKQNEVILITSSANDVAAFEEKQASTLDLQTNIALFRELEKQYHLVHFHVPFIRQNFALESITPTCIVNRVKTKERASQYHFSLPVNIFSTHKIYQKLVDTPIDESLLNEDGELVSLTSLFSQRPTSKLIIVKKASYGPLLQAQLDKLNSANIVAVNVRDIKGKLVEFIKRDRGDFLVQYPLAIEDWQKENKERLALRSYSLSGVEKFIYGHLMCNDSAKSVAFLAAVNDAIKTAYANGTTLGIYEQFLDEESLIEIKEQLAIEYE